MVVVRQPPNPIKQGPPLPTASLSHAVDFLKGFRQEMCRLRNGLWSVYGIEFHHPLNRLVESGDFFSQDLSDSPRQETRGSAIL